MALPLVVVLGVPLAAEALVAEAVEDLGTAGWAVASGWEDARSEVALTPTVGAVVRTGEVHGEAQLRPVVLAALRGDALVVDVRAERRVTEELCDELRRLGDLQVRSVDSGWPALLEEDRRLLDLLAAGRTLGAAAEELHLSRRSADRRLAAARDRLAVRTTGEAVAVRRRRRAASPPPFPS